MGKGWEYHMANQKKTIAMIVPYTEQGKTERKIGILDGKTRIEFRDDFEMTAEELLAMK
jgi:hypothetical protein